MSYVAGLPGRCPACGTPRKISNAYGAVLCLVCDEWQSPTCRSCDECDGRPATPSQARELDLAADEVDATHDLDLADTSELLRRVVVPVLEGTLPAGVVQQVAILRSPGDLDEHWPPDLPPPDDVSCEITLTSGEQIRILLGADGLVDPHDLARELGSQLEDEWAESYTGWGEQVRASYVLPPAPPASAGRARSFGSTRCC